MHPLRSVQRKPNLGEPPQEGAQRLGAQAGAGWDDCHAAQDHGDRSGRADPYERQREEFEGLLAQIEVEGK